MTAEPAAGRVVRVLPDVRALRKTFDYRLPASLADRVRVGTQVRVVLHGRRVAGWVVAEDVEPPPGVTLRPVVSVRGWGPPAAVLALAGWAAWRWAGPVPGFLRTASSAVAVRALPDPPSPRAASSPARPGRPLVAGWTSDPPPLPTGVRTGLRTDVGAGLRAREPEPAPPGANAPVDGATAGGGRGDRHAPGAAEARPLGAGTVRGAAREVAGTALRQGVTVVRLPPAADPVAICLAAAALLPRSGPGAGVLVLAPEHRTATQVARQLERSAVPVALLPRDWAAARAGGVVAVGTRAAAFAPLPRLAAAVVLDAHDEAYHEERAPTWSAWAVVAERVRREGAPCALVSPCPTLELLRAGTLLTTSRASERRGWPAIEVVDRRGDDPRTGLFSERLVHLVRWAAAGPGRRVVCVVNRTGRVRLLACSACGDLARCETCGAALELVGGPAPGSGRVGRGAHRGPAGARGEPTGEARALATADAPNAGPTEVPTVDGGPSLHCRRCGAERPVVCARCGSTRTRSLRLGVSRAREELEVLAGVPVAEVWGPPGAGERGTEVRAAVVVGTEAALHRVVEADAVAFLDFDAELLAPRYRAAEQALALLARAARLVSGGVEGGRNPRAAGRVLVQTRQPHHAALEAAVSADPGILATAESEVRHALNLPPWSALATLSGAAADTYGAALRAAAPEGVEVTGPVDGGWSVRAPDHELLCTLLASVPRPPERLRVAVDPIRS